MDLKKLIQDVNSIIEKAQQDKKYFDDCGNAINWGDLSCSDAEIVKSFYGGDFVRVIIEEVSPESYHFSQFILDELFELGYKNIDIVVTLEW